MVRFLGMEIRRRRDKIGDIARAKANLQHYGYTVSKDEDSPSTNTKQGGFSELKGASKTLKELVELKQMMAVVFPEQAQQIRNSKRNVDDDDTGFSMKDLPELINSLPSVLATLQQINTLRSNQKNYQGGNSSVSPPFSSGSKPTARANPPSSSTEDIKEPNIIDINQIIESENIEDIEDTEDTEETPNVEIDGDFIVIHKEVIIKELENAPSLAKAFLGRMGIDIKNLEPSINEFVDKLAKKYNN